MKKILILLAMASLLLLTGCDVRNTSADGLYDALLMANRADLPDSDLNNAKKTYYTYYLSKGIGREDKSETSNLFIIYENNALLTLDIAGIISRQYYDSEISSSEKISFSNLVFYRHMKTVDTSGHHLEYDVSIYGIDENYNYIIMQSDRIMFVSLCRISQCDEVAFEMVKILRSVAINDEQIIADFSNYEENNSTISSISLFKQVLPESGNVSDYIEDWKQNPAFIIVDEGGEDELPTEDEIKRMQDEIKQRQLSSSQETPGEDDDEDENNEDY